MAVRIENMDMPDNCWECSLCNSRTLFCYMVRSFVDKCTKKRHHKCPLKECE